MFAGQGKNSTLFFSQLLTARGTAALKIMFTLSPSDELLPYTQSAHCATICRSPPRFSLAAYIQAPEGNPTSYSNSVPVH